MEPWPRPAGMGSPAGLADEDYFSMIPHPLFCF